MARLYIGVSGFSYPEWRGRFYPDGLPARSWLAYASRAFNSIELNATFYRLQTPAAYRAWAAAVPSRGFVFAVKGSRWVTHNLKLGHPERGLANFFASGVLELGRATGPFLWQLPRMLRFDSSRVERFLRALPRTTQAAERLARRHDDRVGGAWVRLTARTRGRLRHALEPRHPSFFCEACYALLRRHGCALVIAHGADAPPPAFVLTARFAYVRLHGSAGPYRGRYDEAALRGWARRIRAWRATGRDVYVYFDNDVGGAAPADAARLMRMLRVRPPDTVTPG